MKLFTSATCCLVVASALSAGEDVKVAIFAPGIVSGPAADYAPTFSPDCHTVYFTIGNTADAFILASTFDGTRWQQPRIAPFSGRWEDLEPTWSPDGSYLVFASNRPPREPGEALRASYEGKMQDGGNLWRVDRRGPDWSLPVRLPDTVNASSAVFTPSIARDNSLYFMKASPVTGRFQIFRSQFEGGTYALPVQLPFSDEEWDNVDPAVAPDESFLVFASNRPPTAANDLDLFVVFREHGTWGVPEHLPSPINSPSREIEPRLGPDGHTLLFSSRRVAPVAFPRTQSDGATALKRVQTWDNGANNIWRADLSGWLDERRSTPRSGGAGCAVP